MNRKEKEKNMYMGIEHSFRIGISQSDEIQMRLTPFKNLAEHIRFIEKINISNEIVCCAYQERINMKIE